MKLSVILNPYANRWNARAQQQALESALRRQTIDFDLTLTQSRGHAQSLAEDSAAGGYDAVIAAGGDGTVHEVVCGLATAAGDGPTLPLGIIPIGSGNDFSDMAGLPRNLAEAASTFAAGQTRQVDLATYNGTFFNNNCSAAMEPLVTLEYEKIKVRLPGHVRYLIALVRALLNLKAWQMTIDWDDGSFAGPVFLFSLCNGPRVGSMFRMAPMALIDDGLLDFIMVPEVSKLTVLRTLPRLIPGTHIHMPHVTHGRTTAVRIRSAPGTPVQADGELLTSAVSDLTYAIVPGKLTLLTSASGKSVPV